MKRKSGNKPAWKNLFSFTSKKDRSFLPQLFILAIIVLGQSFSFSAAAQIQTTIDKKTIVDSVNIKIEQRLVDLTLDGPLYNSAEHQNKINEYQLKAAKNSWLNILSLSANYNDQTFAKNTQQNAIVYPKFFTGITIPLGTILSRTGVKAAREGVEISKVNQEQLARTLRAEVLAKYKQYKNYQELIVLQKSVADDYQAAFLQAEAKASETPIEKYNLASKNFSEEQTKLLNLQLQRDLIKLEIEKLIGVDLESVIEEITNLKK